MPGTLRPDAHCPVCGDPLLAIFDQSSNVRTTREYSHMKATLSKPVRPPCTRVLDIHKAGAERRGLEVEPLRAVLDAIKMAPEPALPALTDELQHVLFQKQYANEEGKQ